MRRVVHEMRNHLAVAVANIEAFVDGKLEPTQVRLSAVLHALHEVDVLINDLPRNGATATMPTVEQAIADVCAIIEHESTAMEGFAFERGVNFSVERCAAVHPACMNFYGDPQRIGQIVTNVLTNAIRYTPAGGSVDVVCRREAGCLEFTVRDDGPGISADEMGHIFEPGFRGSAAAAQAGSGIGLALVKDFVERQGGSIAVESEVSQGATFRVRLPGTPTAGDPCRCEHDELPNALD